MTLTHYPLFILSSHSLCKILIVVLGFLTTVFSYYASEDSPWIKEGLSAMCEHIQDHHHKDELVRWTFLHFDYEMTGEHCPSTMTERLSVWCLIFLTSVSAILLLICCYVHIETVNAIRYYEAVYHLLVGLTHVIIGLVLLVNLFKLDSNTCNVRDRHSQKTHSGSRLCSQYIQIQRKFVSSGFCVGLGAVYLVAAFVIYKVNFRGMSAPGSHNERIERRSRTSDLGSIAHRMSRAGHAEYGHSDHARHSYDSFTKRHKPLPKPGRLSGVGSDASVVGS